MCKKSFYGGWMNQFIEFFDLTNESFEERCAGFFELSMGIAILLLTLVLCVYLIRGTL